MPVFEFIVFWALFCLCGWCMVVVDEFFVCLSVTGIKRDNKVIYNKSNSINDVHFWGLCVYDSIGSVCLYKYNKVSNK